MIGFFYFYFILTTINNTIARANKLINVDFSIILSNGSINLKFP